ncbi:MAG: HTH domain-containing protein [Cellulosilyticaceae bacterium]
MKDYTPKEMKTLQSNPYTLKVTKHKLYFTKEFKEQFWVTYEAGVAQRQILKEFGYDLDMFGQKQIDSIVQAIKRQANSPYGFREGENRQRRMEVKDIQDSRLRLRPHHGDWYHTIDTNKSTLPIKILWAIPAINLRSLSSISNGLLAILV